jgi:outer membrane receptor protein involved in Fe transport
LWAAVSHAVRSPTPFDEDVQERLGAIVALSGNCDFRTEKLTAYELGIKAQPLAELSFSATGFYHHYGDLRSVELIPGPAFLNLQWGNGLKGHSYGLEAWASASPLDHSGLHRSVRAKVRETAAIGLRIIGVLDDYLIDTLSRDDCKAIAYQVA